MLQISLNKNSLKIVDMVKKVVIIKALTDDDDCSLIIIINLYIMMMIALSASHRQDYVASLHKS